MNTSQAPVHTLTLSLLENSHLFWKEAVQNVLDARTNVLRWQFAFLHLVQSIELSIKALLAQKHPIFIYENIDKMGARPHTVTITVALDRLTDSRIGNIALSPPDKAAIRKAADQRNSIVHNGFEINLRVAEIHFFEAYALLHRLQTQFLQVDARTVIPEEMRQELIGIGVAVKEMAGHARSRIKDEAVDPASILDCPECGERTFVFREESGTCYTCSHADSVGWCDSCEKPNLMANMAPSPDSWRRYGYEYTLTCYDCSNKIESEIHHTLFMDDEWIHW